MFSFCETYLFFPFVLAVWKCQKQDWEFIMEIVMSTKLIPRQNIICLRKHRLKKQLIIIQHQQRWMGIAKIIWITVQFNWIIHIHMTWLKEENRYDDDDDDNDNAFNRNWLFYLQVIKMLLLIVVLFLLCWGPRLVMMVMIKIGLSQGDFTHSVYTARISFYLLSFIHSALNPFVYGFMSSNFRKMVFNSCHSCGLTVRTRNEHSEGYPLTRMNTLVTQSTRITNNNSFV